MDPLSMTASIVAVIQLSSDVVKYVNSAAGATKERKRLRDEVRACEQILQSLKDDADDSEEGHAWSGTIKALEDTGAPLGRLWIILNVVKVKLEPKEGLQKVISKLKWPFDEKEIEKIISTIEREKDLLHLALTNDCRKLIEVVKKSSIKNGKHLEELIRAIQENSKENGKQFMTLHDRLAQVLGSQSGLRDGVDELRKHQITQEQQSILDWLTHIDFAPQQNDFLALRQAGTGKWLLESAEFQKWLESHRQTLFCPGMPGAGKTILTAIVIDYLNSRFENNPNVGIAYFYYNFRRQDEQKVEDVLASLLKQLAQSQSPFPYSVTDLYNRHQVRRTRASLDQILRTLKAVAAQYTKTIIIVDALDECQKSHRMSFLSNILDVQRECGANVFVTSRDILRITESFEEFVTLQIRASDEDVQRYVQGQVSQLPTCVARSQGLQSEIEERIIKAVDGMFLLAKLYLDSLKGKSSPKAIRNVLNSLPTGSEAYDHAYNDAMMRIEGQLKDEERLAKQVLSWITCAKRPLTTTELEHALAVEVGSSQLDEENLCQVEDMIPVCAGLVTVDEETDIIRLVHYTTQEYFERKQHDWFPNANIDITMACVTYLSFDVFNSGACRSIEKYKKRLQLHRLYHYAACNWGYHARETLACMLIVTEFLNTEEKVNACNQVHATKRAHSNHKKGPLRLRQVTGLHLAAYFGLEDTAKLLLETGAELDTGDEDGRTPLSWAAKEGHEAVVKLLLISGAKLDLDDDDSHTPLSWAAKEGHEAVVRLLLRSGAKVDSDDRYGRTPLSRAAPGGYVAVVKLLLTSGANVDSYDTDGWTPLSWAVEKGQEAVIKLLLESGAKVNSCNKEGQTPLSCAAEEGHEGVAKLLIDSGAKVNCCDKVGRTPLSWAVSGRHLAIVKLLIDRGAKVNTYNEYGHTPLLWAAEDGHEAIVKLLLHSGAEVDSYDKEGWTPLLLAVEQGHDVVERILIEHGANIEDFYGLGALFGDP